jgi:hypothetical protein
MPRKKATKTKGRKGKAKRKSKAKPVVAKKRRNRRNRDPNRPKRSMSAFMFFSNANRDIVKAQNPSLSFTDIAREIGSRWAGLSATDRRPYATLAQQDKDRYLDEKRMYTPDPKYIQEEVPGKPKKDPNAPKRAMSGFMFFSNHMRPKLQKKKPNIAFLDLGRQIGALWRGMNDTKRKPYMKLAEEDSRRYREEKARYVPDPKYLSAKARKKDPNAPKRAMSGYLFFCQAHRKNMQKQYPKKKMTEIASLLAGKWRQASASQKAKFQRESDKDKARYTREKKAYDRKK